MDILIDWELLDEIGILVNDMADVIASVRVQENTDI